MSAGHRSASDLPPMDIAARLPRLRALLPEAGIDALLVTRRPNVAYLTGFTGSAGTLLVRVDGTGPTGAGRHGTESDGTLLMTDGRYREQSEDQLHAGGVDARVTIAATQDEQRDALRDGVGDCHRIGLEAHGVTWADQRRYADLLAPRELVPTEHLVERLRAIKEDAEVARIAACAIADEALAEVLPGLHERPSERRFALALEWAMRERGATGTSFETIIASGPNGSKPHARPTDRAIEAGELVVIDFGCIVDGYCSDMTRTVSVGDPGPDARRVWDVVAESQRAGRDAVRAGVTCAAVDRASRAVIEDAGWGPSFAHGTGHGVGLEIHEAPRVSASADGTLEPGHVVTVEPGVYLPGTGGVRIEDTVVVTSDGSVALTEFPKYLVI